MKRYELRWCGSPWAETREMCEDPDGEWIGYDDHAAEVEQLTAERDQIKARVEELEAPPVVPEGWEVTCVIRAQRDGWALSCGDSVVGVWYPDTGQVRITTLAPAGALRAFAWAIEHDQRPPHALQPALVIVLDGPVLRIVRVEPDAHQQDSVRGEGDKAAGIDTETAP